jgi:hypothetical protein
MDSYDHRVVAGLGGYRFSETLLELSNFVGIPPPEFRGRRVYKEYGLQKWDIQTIIRGREEDPEDPTMEFTNAYTDWSRSVEIAIQGGCGMHLPQVPPTFLLDYTLLPLRRTQ